MTELAIQTTGLCRSFGSLRAVDGVDLAVARGTCFGLLGHNGAGKTTTIRMLTGRLRPTSGTARVLGADVVDQREEFRPRINLVSDRQNLHPRLTARTTMQFWANLYGVSTSRVDELLERVGLDPSRKGIVRDYSTGMRQRLVIARGLINDPDLLFLDEPTRGLDPGSARTLRGIVRDLAASGTTICLTTHDMVEAQELCDEIAIMGRGRVVASGTPDQLRSLLGDAGRPRVSVRTVEGAMLDLDLADEADRDRLANLLRDDGVQGLHTHEPTLTDVFIHFAGPDPESEESDS